MICKLCLNEYFLDPKHRENYVQSIYQDEPWDGDWREHHLSANSWDKSSGESCSICTVLYKDFCTAIDQEINPGKTIQVIEGRVAHPRLKIQDVDDKVGYWPLYEGTLRGDATGLWILKLRPFQEDEEEVAKGNFEQEQQAKRLRKKLPERIFVVYKWEDSTNKDSKDAHIPGPTNPEPSFTQMKKWINDCNTGKGHRNCKLFLSSQQSRLKPLSSSPPDPKSPLPFIPTRLLDLEAFPSNPHQIRLIETSGKIMAKYMTLSHKWGSPDLWPLEPRLTRSTLPSFLSSIPLASLPQTFRDAITVTRELGIRYLWIDSLCIVQSDGEDWHAEAPKMARVYGGSWCNLGAGTAFDARGGLFGTREGEGGEGREGIGPEKFWANSGLLPKGWYGVVREDFWEGELLGLPLYSRGWVFQERMLSPRILHFGNSQIFFQCISLSASESAPAGLPQGIRDLSQNEARFRRGLHRGEFEATSRKRKDALRLDDVWAAAVGSYTSCDLTNGGDKLMAIAGVAEEVQKGLDGERYLAGLWEGDLHEGLGWRVFGTPRRPAYRVKKWRAPSWAWTSVEGLVELRNRAMQGRAWMAKVMEVDVRLEVETVPLGKVLPGTSMRIQGKILRMWFTSPSPGIGGESDLTTKDDDVSDGAKVGEMKWFVRDKDTEKLWCRAYLDDLSDQSQAESDAAPGAAEYTVLLLAYTHNQPPMTPEGYSGHGLLIGSSGLSDGHFSRIGCLQFQSLDDDAWKALQTYEITTARDAKSISFDPEQGHVIVLE